MDITAIKTLGSLTLALALTSCANRADLSATDIEQYSALTVTQGLLLLPQFSALERPQAKFPIDEARAGVMGCAETELVLLPGNRLASVKAIKASTKSFAEQAVLAVKDWNWSSLPKDALTKPVKTKIAFGFCMAYGKTGTCKVSQAQFGCEAADFQYSIGRAVYKGAEAESKHRELEKNLTLILPTSLL
ncbi:energy transducer TonB [Paraferrimonas sedimenticola]|uniref:TonB C-terminal domain-containing protein n=1 Tax=Paraferrimonas sedimenticola TaxID=375674 RepID=A0AA37RU53_9GAMM|nr:energy transducer TonB [Paraferrimonas sedimenticola]GLP95193.1 hypothetical protein GCM10007895_04990 [Paraferrimonas sedimenticola]